mgnify:CR=1 FL=1
MKINFIRGDSKQVNNIVLDTGNTKFLISQELVDGGEDHGL